MVLTGFAREIHADLQSLNLEHPDSKINEREKMNKKQRIRQKNQYTEGFT